MRIFTLDNVLSPAECVAMIARAEAQTFEVATINPATGATLNLDVRNNDRVIFNDAALAADLWERVREQIPQLVAGRESVGLNDCFRFYRYDPGQKFDWHTDGSFARQNGERSLLTFMIYLNEGYDGGETRFECEAVKGKAGQALVFNHELRHTGAEVLAGRKYVLRSDVMYVRR